MRVGGEGFVSIIKQWRVGDMVGIRANMTSGARKAVSFHPPLHQFQLCHVVAIMPVNPRQHMAAAVGR